jgi:hypothetical protein
MILGGDSTREKYILQEKVGKEIGNLRGLVGELKKTFRELRRGRANEDLDGNSHGRDRV